MTRPLRALLGAAALACVLAAAPARAESGAALQILPDPSRLAILIALFAALIPALNGLVFRPLLRVLDEREKRMSGARAQAGDVAREAAALLDEHHAAVREAREASNAERALAVDAARRSHQAVVAAARQSAERELAGARSEIATAVESTRAQLRADAEPLAREAAERLLGRRLA